MWVGLAACALAAAASAALGTPPDPAVLALAAAGTLAVYVLDRLRDVERDRATAPARTAFVVRHRTALAASGVVAGGVAAGAALHAGGAATGIAAGALAFGVAHRRLKHVLLLKPAYLTATWVAVTVGMPALRAGASSGRLAWVVVVQTLAILANVIASNLRDREGATAVIGPRRALALARGVAGAGVIVALLAPPAVRPLAAVPIAMGAALAAYRGGERYGLVVVDGALLAGALVALAVGGMG